jgi:thiol-disulfide isomerase/thioredoxin
MKTIIYFSIFLLSTFASQAQLKKGIWRGILKLSETKSELILPFNFEVSYPYNLPIITVINAAERISVNEVSIEKDSVIIKMPVFDTGFRLKLFKDTLKGYWINYAKQEKNKIYFEAYFGEENRFIPTNKPSLNFSGRYKVVFSPNTKNAYDAIGIFDQINNKLTGTFLTETGDYRFLEGMATEDKIALSCFDGSHAFLFFANSTKRNSTVDTLTGKVFYGISGSEDWIAYRNDTFELKDPESITTLKSIHEKVDFSFKNLNNQTISLSDKQFKNKVVIIQIMGSWCPNCMDETKYLTEVYNKYHKKGLEIVALAYERTNDFEKAKSNVLRLKKRFNAEYEFLITGLTGKDKASESLPFLTSISAFPTTIILNKNHALKSIYTGFSGPATGKAYEVYKLKTENLIEQLLLDTK